MYVRSDHVSWGEDESEGGDDLMLGTFEHFLGQSLGLAGHSENPPI